MYQDSNTPVVDGLERDKVEPLGQPIIDVSQADPDDIGGETEFGDSERVLPIAPTTLLVVRTDAALPQRRSRRDAGQDVPTPDARLLTALGRAAPPDLPPVSALGLETALEAMAPASKLAQNGDA